MAVMVAVPDARWKAAQGRRSFEAHACEEHSMLSDNSGSTALHATALLRVGNGIGLLAHGALLKLGTFGLAGTMAFFGSIGYPPLLGAVVIAIEVAAGLALIAGVGVRVASLAVVPVMLGAVLTHLPNGWVFNAPNGGWEYPAFWAVALLAQAGLGAGSFALGSRLPERRPVAA